MKTCTKCHIEKSESEFYRKGKGLETKCKSCKHEYYKVQYAKKHDLWLERDRKYRENNKEKTRLRLKKYRETHKEEISIKNKKIL